MQPDVAHKQKLLPPGFHLVANLTSHATLRLASSGPFRAAINPMIDAAGLARVGEAYHDFPGGGFTGVICLAESHLSIHTWPADGYITFDIFLSNYSRDNRPSAQEIYRQVLDFFSAEVRFEKIISR